MPGPLLKEEKSEYLDLIDLIIRCRRQPLGKTGLTYLPGEAVNSMMSGEHLEKFVKQLARDDVLATVEDGKFAIIEEEDKKFFCVVNCRKTAEEIEAYRDSLAVDPDGVVVKRKKRITLPSFPRTDWIHVVIRFAENDQDVLLSGAKDVKTLNFEGMGCMDGRTGKPDDAWKFLVELARGQGTTAKRSKVEREAFKKQKQKTTDILRKIFQNDTDPFEHEEGGTYRAKFSIGYIETGDPQKAKPVKDKFADAREVFDEMTPSIEERDRR